LEWRPETFIWVAARRQLGARRSARVLKAIPGAVAGGHHRGAPGAISGDQARHWTACGINRVSLAYNRSSKKRFAARPQTHAEIVAREIRLLREAAIAASIST